MHRCTVFVALAWVACSPNGSNEPDPDARGPSRDGGLPSNVDARIVDEDNLTWRDANLTNFTSYPEPGSEECEDFSGCEYAGRFAFVDGQQSEEWVMQHNIAAVHSDDADAYALKTLRVRSGANRIDVTVYDMCSDSDCGGCCTRNSAQTGFLIDLESYTAARFGVEHDIVEFACLDCE
ncbi:MAG TPA: hypothetical protein VM261_14550 [Kofleriaceae bacterium]|nr:hypothetical protein [Kofleriaceae bacterium]